MSTRKRTEFSEPLGKIGHERNSVRLRALADPEGGKQFRFRVNCHKCPLIANASLVITPRDLALPSDLKGHPKAARAYAWSSPIEGSTKRRFFAVLHMGAIKSPQNAVRAAIVAEHRATE
ncbi:MAG TPA: hypothetical protein VIE66_03250 [Methylocella sp.]